MTPNWRCWRRGPSRGWGAWVGGGSRRPRRRRRRWVRWGVGRGAERIRRVGGSAAASGEDGGLPERPWPGLLLGRYAALRLPHDFRDALATVLRWGGGADAAAAITGALLGAAQ